MNSVTKGYTVTNLIKSSGLLSDVRLLLSAWDESKTIPDNFDSAVRRNIFGKATRKRVTDILQVLKHRYLLQDGSDTAFRLFVNSSLPSEITDQIFYYYTALSEPMIYDFVTDYLYDRYFVGDRSITIRNALEFISEAIRQGKTEGKWESINTRERVAQGLLSTLRDFGILNGAKNSREKSIIPINLHVRSFGYIAYHIKQKEPSGERLINHRHWRLFFQSPRSVERLFTEADAERLLTYQAAGSIIRIEFPTTSFVEYVNALVTRTL